MILCKNCEFEFEGKFCPACSQKANTKRITTKIIFSDVLKKILPWDKGFLYTTRRLLLSPGNMVREYLAGKRVDYTKPLQFLFFVVATSLIVFSTDDFAQEFNKNGLNSNAGNEFSQKITAWIYGHIALVFTGLIPFLAIFSKMFYRKSGLNYAEHLVFNLYLMAGCSIVSTPFTGIGKIIGWGHIDTIWIGVSTVAYLIYYTWGYFQFFRPGNKIWGALKPLLIYLLGYLLYILVMSVVIGIGVMVYVSVFGKM